MNYQKIKKHLSQTYDSLADSWGSGASDRWGLDNLKKFAKIIKDNNGHKVLDLGCGSGIQSKELMEEGLDVVGLDLSLKMINEAKKKASTGHFIAGDMTKMSFDSASFDGVYARASLLHIPKSLVPEVLNSVSNVLKNRGFFYLAIKKGKTETEIEGEKYGRKIKRFFSFFDEEEIQKLLDKAGFEIINITSEVKIKNSKTVWIEIVARKI